MGVYSISSIGGARPKNVFRREGRAQIILTYPHPYKISIIDYSAYYTTIITNFKFQTPMHVGLLYNIKKHFTLSVLVKSYLENGIILVKHQVEYTALFGISSGCPQEAYLVFKQHLNMAAKIVN